MAFSVALRTEIIMLFLSVGRRYRVFRERWVQNHPNNPIPTRVGVYKIVKKFSRLGNVADAPRSGRRKTARNPQVIEAVREAFVRLARANNDGEEESVGVRAVALEVGISHTSVWRIARFDMKWRGYKPRLVQTLLPDDAPRRVLFANQILHRLQHDNNFINFLIWSDESTFTLRGHVST